MKASFQGNNNKRDINFFEKSFGVNFVSEEIYTQKSDGHKFKPGDSAELSGLESYPEFNGIIVEISAIRKDGEHGKAYYFKTDNLELSEQLNWIYEYRLKPN